MRTNIPTRAGDANRRHGPAAGLGRWREVLSRLTLAATAFVVMTGAASATCDRHPGDFLVGTTETETAYIDHCESPATASDMRELVQDLDRNLANPPSEELVGSRWQFRKGVIDTAGCVARAGTLYDHRKSGADTWAPSYRCANPDRRLSECSNLSQYSDRHAACFIHGFYSAKDDVMKPLGIARDAQGQYGVFEQHGALMAKGGSPFPGDTVFFCCTSNKGTPITHAAIYLGRRSDGTMLVIQAVSSGVKIGPLSDKLEKLVVGFGNAGKLYAELAKGR